MQFETGAYLAGRFYTFLNVIVNRLTGTVYQAPFHNSKPAADMTANLVA